jgi:hypothetical protein
MAEVTCKDKRKARQDLPGMLLSTTRRTVMDPQQHFVPPEAKRPGEYRHPLASTKMMSIAN